MKLFPEKNLTQKEIVLRVLEVSGLALNRHEILEVIFEHNLGYFGGKTPDQTISRILSTALKENSDKLCQPSKGRYQFISEEDPFLWNEKDRNLQILLNNVLIPETEKDVLVKQRIGQSLFRKTLDHYWEGGCALTGFRQRQALRASHIVPWRENYTSRLDAHNGLLLRADIDALFDAHFISFSQNGSLLVGNSLSQADREMLPKEGTFLRKNLEKSHHYYLEKHRHVFLEKNHF